MPVDTTPAQSAASLLNGIDYSGLIGGPLQAAIKAQAMAANSTWEFIQQIGLNPADADGNRSAINVTFLYQKDGTMAKMIVPLITIVPIPLIVVTDISIDFTANINASASSTQEDSSATDVGGELEAEGKIGWGPFSLSAKLKASYSSKQASKATQDSRYSVEYTQKVSVKAGQADVPAGLATVLNILSNAATGASSNGELTVSPALVTMVPKDTATRQLVELRTVNANALAVAGTSIEMTIQDQFKDAFVLYHFLTGEVIQPETAGKWVLTTGKNGRVAFYLGVAEDVAITTPPNPVFTLKATIKGDKEPSEVFLPVAIRQPPAPEPPPELGGVIDLRAPRKLTSASALSVAQVESHSWRVSFTGRAAGEPAVPIRVSYDAQKVKVLQDGKEVTNGEELALDERGDALVSFNVAADATPGVSQVVLNATVGDTPVSREIPIRIS